MGMHIDKPGRQHAPLPVNHLLRRQVQRRGHIYNPIALHRHVAAKLWSAAAVNDRDVFEKPVNFHRNYSLSTLPTSKPFTRRKNSGKLRKNQIKL